MKTISTTFEFNGLPIKIENGRIFLRAFGTTINNHSMHWSWVEVSIDKLKPELQEHIKSTGLL